MWESYVMAAVVVLLVLSVLAEILVKLSAI